MIALVIVLAWIALTALAFMGLSALARAGARSDLEADFESPGRGAPRAHPRAGTVPHVASPRLAWQLSAPNLTTPAPAASVAYMTALPTADAGPGLVGSMSLS